MASNSSLEVESFSFSQEELRVLSSIIYQSLLYEADRSDSFSRVFKYFRDDQKNQSLMMENRVEKKKWIEEWKKLSCSLLGFEDLVASKDLQKNINELSLSEGKKVAMTIELATFKPYIPLSKGDEVDDLRFGDKDKKNYFESCSFYIYENSSELFVEKFYLAEKKFKKCVEKVMNSVAGPNNKWAWIGATAALALFIAPEVGAFVGEMSGLYGAAATTYGLAILGGGSIATSGLGMSGASIFFMTGGAIFGYGGFSLEYKMKVLDAKKEDLLIQCSKLYAALLVSGTNTSDKEDVCGKVLDLQVEFEKKSDHRFLIDAPKSAKEYNLKAEILRGFRKFIRGDLK